jgi:hypothetical protein
MASLIVASQDGLASALTNFLQLRNKAITTLWQDNPITNNFLSPKTAQTTQEVNMKKFIWIALSAALLSGGLVLTALFPAQPVQAADGPVIQSTPGALRSTLEPLKATLAALPTADGAYLESLLLREQLAYNNQTTRLDMSANVSSLTQAYIDEQKAAGKDTAGMESALADFNSAAVQAQTAHAAAGTILDAKSGFDANGKVTDRTAAQETIRSAAQSLRQAHLTITDATLNLRLAVQTFRQSN